MAKPFTATDLEVAHDKLCPHIQKLVDRFGQAQAHEVVIAVLEQVCPDAGTPEYMCLRKERPKAAN